MSQNRRPVAARVLLAHYPVDYPTTKSKPHMPTLFDPVRAGDLHLPNRIVMAPLTRHRAPAAIPTR